MPAGEPIDTSVAGVTFVGLCPGPAIANLATLSARAVAFVLAMAAGMLALDFLAAAAGGCGGVGRNEFSPNTHFARRICRGRRERGGERENFLLRR
jgi:hypothetical protein